MQRRPRRPGDPRGGPLGCRQSRSCVRYIFALLVHLILPLAAAAQGGRPAGIGRWDPTLGFPGESPTLIRVDEASGGTMCIGGRWHTRPPAGLGALPPGGLAAVGCRSTAAMAAAQLQWQSICR